MHRRALLATLAAVPLAGCPAPPWVEVPDAVDGAEVTLRREHTGEFASGDTVGDAAVLHRDLDADPPTLTVRGQLLAGARECDRVTLLEAALSEGTLALRLATEDDPAWGNDACPDVAASHPYQVAVAFRTAPVPDRVVVDHGDDRVLDERV